MIMMLIPLRVSEVVLFNCQPMRAFRLCRRESSIHQERVFTQVVHTPWSLPLNLLDFSQRPLAALLQFNSIPFNFISQYKNENIQSDSKFNYVYKVYMRGFP